MQCSRSLRSSSSYTATNTTIITTKTTTPAIVAHNKHIMNLSTFWIIMALEVVVVVLRCFDVPVDDVQMPFLLRYSVVFASAHHRCFVAMMLRRVRRISSQCVIVILSNVLLNAYFVKKRDGSTAIRERVIEISGSVRRIKITRTEVLKVLLIVIRLWTEEMSNVWFLRAFGFRWNIFIKYGFVSIKRSI